jgi:SET domain-containing protein
MPLLEKHLFVKKSSLPKAGKGLFTKTAIKKGTRIVEYKGRLQSWKEVKAQDGFNGYLMYITRNAVINALPAVKTLGRYANDAMGLTRIEGMRNNAEYVSEGSRCFIEATKNIKPGEEILVGYGREYWNLIRKIIRSKSLNKTKRGTQRIA